MFRIKTGPHQYGRLLPGIGDRLLATWDVHGVMEELCKAMGLLLPEGEDAYLNAQAQFDWVKTALNIPAVAYGDLMRLLEVWVMGVPATEVRVASIIVSFPVVKWLANIKPSNRTDVPIMMSF